ncbi:hypothetical protein QYE76_048500 [Lolium multiflorum]|uniref:MSP domain-containing protein n=1 Tax=Lolium multiflorum TaxID=4521 RepID=A0AAD8WFY5_LOLMU|nr:hypothetical protein QYE76_048500 [Lolium multiflorum]
MAQAVDPALLDAIVPLQSQHRKSSVASTQQVDNDDDDQVVEPPRYPVDDLTESRPCELHVKVFNLSFKAAVGILLPTRTYHCRPVQDDFAVVMVDEVLRDYEQLVLEHPAGEDGEIKELGEARRTTVQWRKENIVFPAPKRSSTPMRAQTPELLPHEQTDEQKAFLAPKKIFIPPHTMKHFAETRIKRAEPRSDYDRSLGKSYRASKAKNVAQLGQQDKQSVPHFVVQPYDDPETASMIEREARGQEADVQYEDYYPTAQVVNKYRYGSDLIKPGELAILGTQMRRLHEWYLKACRRGDRYLTMYLRDEHYFRGREEINLELEELFQLFNQDASTKLSSVATACKMKKLECKRGKLHELRFIDPDTVHEVTVRQYPKDTEDNMLSFHFILVIIELCLCSFHFILLIIDLHKGVVNVMDSKHKEHAEWANMAAMLQRAWKRFINTVPGKWKPELTFKDYPISPYLEDDMLGIEPLELCFPFELNNQISCSLQLTNGTNAFIAFSIQTTSPLPYCIQRNQDIVAPRSKYSVNITLQPLENAPHDKHTGNFIGRSTKVNGSLISEDITDGIFNREEGKLVDEVNLTITYKAEVPQMDVSLESLIISDTRSLHGPQESSVPPTDAESEVSIVT